MYVCVYPNVVAAAWPHGEGTYNGFFFVLM